MEIIQTLTGNRSERPSATAVPSVGTRADAKSAAESLALGEALQAGARLKLVLGTEKRMVAVSGIKEDDGSSLLTAGLGAALASLDQNPVLVIDANAESSSLSRIFGLPDGPGLLNVLDRQAEVNEVTTSALLPNLSFLSLGQSGRTLSSLTGTRRCTEVMDEIRGRYRYVLLDCGTIRDSPGSMLLASLSDGIVCAVSAAARRRTEIQSFQQALLCFKIPLLGIVLTTTPKANAAYA